MTRRNVITTSIATLSGSALASHSMAITSAPFFDAPKPRDPAEIKRRVERNPRLKNNRCCTVTVKVTLEESNEIQWEAYRDKQDVHDWLRGRIVGPSTTSK